MVSFLILDLDGVLITTPNWRPDPLNTDGYSDFSKKLVMNLNRLLTESHWEIWLSSSRRTQKSLEEFNVIFANRGIDKEISGFLPEVTKKTTRKNEVQHFIKTHDLKNYLIIDDDITLGGLEPELKNWWIKTEPLTGFNEEKLHEALQKVKTWL